MKKLFSILIIMLSLTSCQKILWEKEPVTMERFSGMLSSDQQYVITAYYDNYGDITIADLSRDDIYTFQVNEGIIVSVDPCITTYIPLDIYEEDGHVKMNWVDLQLQYETFTVVKCSPGQYFLLQGQNNFLKYSIVAR